jgi:cell division protein FtsW
MADKRLFFLVFTLITVGLIFSYSLSTYTVIFFEYEPYHFVLRQLLFASLALMVMWFLSGLTPEVWLHRIGLLLFIMGLVVMAMMPFLPETMVTAVGGARRWIKLFGFSLAPVEFFKIGFVYFLAWSFSRKFHHQPGANRFKEEWILALPYMGVFLIAVLLIAVLQNDLGQVVVLGMTLAFMMLFAGRSFKFFVSLVGLALTIFIFFIAIADHRVLRIKLWWYNVQDTILSFFPASIAERLHVDLIEEPYQIAHSLNAFSNGGWFGTGIGNGNFKLGFLSEVHTDFVLAGISEEIGFLGLFIITMVFVLFIMRLFRIANRCVTDMSGDNSTDRSRRRAFFLFTLGIAMLMAFSFIINAFGISGLTPIKGISVPFISYGGSALLGSAVAVGMVLMITQRLKL